MFFLRRGVFILQPRLDRGVLFIEVCEVRHKVFDDGEVRERGNGEGFFCHGCSTSEGIDSIDIHRARATDAFSTGAAKGEGWVYSIFDINESI